ncbi:MAG: extracellular solute-binding protein [Bacteroidetes bacterium]|nr:extracellular solute-binding protein [Bacteroidota bacterium]
MKRIGKALLLLTISLLLFSCNNQSENADEQITAKEVTVYSQRHYESDDSLYALFTKQTGIKVNLIKAKADELINKLQLEGGNSPADVFITVDAERLIRAKQKNLLQPISSDVLSDITSELKDSSGYWTALTYRARVLACINTLEKNKLPATYQELASLKWKGRILVRSSESGYNQALLSSIIFNTNETIAKQWAASIVQNLAREPKGNDRDQMKAVAAGVGDVAIVNSYYYALLLQSKDKTERDAASKLKIIFPNQNESGTHVNISGVALTASSPNKENAIQLIKFLLGKDAQEYLTIRNCEYPANRNVQANEVLKQLSVFKADFNAVAHLEENHEKAMMIFNEVGWK